MWGLGWEVRGRMVEDGSHEGSSKVDLSIKSRTIHSSLVHLRPQMGSRREEAYLEANRITVLTSTIVRRI